MPAVGAHHTATSDATWDAGAQEKNIPSDASAAVLGDVYAWKPTGSDADSKTNWKFPHHFVSADGKPGDASTVACSAVVAALNGGRGGADIPAGDKQGVYNHVIAHLKDSGVKEADLPELKSSRRPLTTRALLDPHFEKRKERRSGMRGKREVRNIAFERGNIEMRARSNGTGGTAFRFEGYAAVFNTPFQMWDWWGDEYVEIVNEGAFTRTLGASPDVPFLIGHDDSGLPLARTRSGTMTLTQDSTGLHVLVPAMDGNSPVVQALASAVERGDMDEMSCAFVTRQCMWSPDYEQRNMVELDLHRGDVSAVVLGANGATAGSTMIPVSGEATSRRDPHRRTRDAAQTGDEEMDTTTAPDYNPAPHAAPADQVHCPNPECDVSGGALNAPDARYCDQCGAPLYDSDGLMVLDDSGVVEEAAGAADLLSLHRAQLERLKIGLRFMSAAA